MSERISYERLRFLRDACNISRGLALNFFAICAIVLLSEVSPNSFVLIPSTYNFAQSLAELLRFAALPPQISSWIDRQRMGYYLVSQSFC